MQITTCKRQITLQEVKFLTKQHIHVSNLALEDWNKSDFEARKSEFRLTKKVAAWKPHLYSTTLSYV